MVTDQKKTLLPRHSLLRQPKNFHTRYTMESIEALRRQLAQEKKASEALQTSVVALQNQWVFWRLSPISKCITFPPARDLNRDL